MLFEKGYRGHPIRKVAIQVGQLSTRGQMQLSLFEDVTKRQPVTYTMDEIRLKYGKSVLWRAIFYQKEGMTRYRYTLMGGHPTD